MALLKLLIPLFCCALLVKSDRTDRTIQEPETENWESLPLISPVLEYLNSNPNKVYDYKKGVLLTSQNKGDIVEVSIEVHVDCNNHFPEIPCNERTLVCHAFMGRDPVMAHAYNVMSDVRCSPKIEITVEDMDVDVESRNVAPMVMGEQNMGGEKLDLSNEALSPDQGSADFIAVRKDNGPCLGCPFELNRDAEGVEELLDTAVKHIESERTQRHRITYVRKLQQQVVAGLKYTLVADVAQTSCPKDADLSAPCVLDTTVEPFVCEVIFIEKPWISKNKHVIKNNCTISQEFEPVVHSRPDRNDISNEIIPHKVMDKPYPVPSPQPDIPNYDAMAQSGNMDQDRLAELESQILLDGMFEAPAKIDSSTNVAAPQFVQNEYAAVDEPLSFSTDFDSLRVEPLPREPSMELKTLTASMPIVDDQVPMAVMYTPQYEEFDRSSSENVLPEFRTTMDAILFDYYPTAFDPSRLSRELNSDYSDQGTKQEVLTKRAAPSTSEEKSAEENSDSNSEEKKPASGHVSVVKREASNTSEDSDSSSDSDDAKQKKNNGRSSKPEVSKCEDDSDSSDSSEEDKGQEKECRSSKIQKSKTKDVKDDSDSSDSSEENKKSNARDHDNNVNRERRSVGQLEKISPDEKVIVRDLADFAAATLDSIDDDHHKRVILQILGAKKLKLDGIYYQIILRLGISHCLEYEHHENCRDKLFTNLTKICKVQVHVEDDFSNPKVVKSQCQNIKKDENDRRRTNYSRYRRQVARLVGGQSPLPEAEAHEYLKKCLVHLASSSPGGDGYRVEQLLNATKQVVAGSLFRISARLTSSKCAKEEPATSQCASKVCKFKIWEKPWMNFTEITANCEGMPEKTFRSKREIGGWDRRQLLGADALSRTPDHLKAIEIIKQALNYLSTKTDPGKVYKLINITHAQHTDMLPQFELWHVDADIALCQRTGLMPSSGRLRFTSNQCPEKAQLIDCHFGVLKRSKSVLEGLKVIIDCANDDRTYVYEPVKKLDDRLGSADELEPAFREFAAKYKKVYDDDTEFKFRMKVFRDNLNKIALLNKYEMGTARYGITAFADLTEKEFSRGHGYRPDMRHENELPFAMAKIPDIELAETVDWRTKGAVTEVKNQGLCGSCWAFSVTGNVEGQYAIKHGKLLEFSEQELVDCDKVDQGCNGGLMDDAYRVIEKLGGLETETDYPYEGDDEKCSFNPNKVRVQLTGALNISHDETDMAKWLAQNGPISIAINANAMQFYFGGVSHPWKMLCSPTNLDHGVLIVGYGTDKYSLFNKTLPYWIVKNSWGTSWGEQGYYRVYRGDGTCGLNQTPSSAIVA